MRYLLLILLFSGCLAVNEDLNNKYFYCENGNQCVKLQDQDDQIQNFDFNYFKKGDEVIISKMVCENICILTPIDTLIVMTPDNIGVYKNEGN